MNILLVQNSLYYPAFGGGNKSNRLLLEALAGRGHACRVITRVSESFDPEKQAAFLRDLERRGIQPETSSGVVVYKLNGVEVHTETHISRLREYLVEQIRDFHPAWTLVSSDDPAQLFLKPALDASSGRVVYLARTTLALPFGPDCAFRSEQKTEALRQVAGIVTVSDYVRRYIEQHGPIPAIHLPISLQGKGPFPNFAQFDTGAVAMVNPCAIKGVDIFAGLAERFPEFPFLAVPTWGTTADDLRQLRQLPNVRIMEPVDDIDEVLRQTRVLVVPSLWAEARSRIVVEGMLRGIPVLGADSGGIPEAMMGVDYLLPVRPIAHYQPQVDERMVPVAIVPAQDLAPWEQALGRLLRDRADYERVSADSRRKAQEYVDSISITPFEEYLKHLTIRPRPQPDSAGAASGLSPAKRALLAKILRQKRADAPKLIIPRVASGSEIPLTFAQERYWRLQQADRARLVGNVGIARRIRGPLAPQQLEGPLNRIIERHQILRTSITESRQHVRPPRPLPIVVSDAAGPEIAASISSFLRQPFDLAAGPLVRVRVLRLSPAEHVLMIALHHIVADGWSFGVFARELRGDCPELEIQYPDYAVWQRSQYPQPAAFLNPPTTFAASRRYADLPKPAIPPGVTPFVALLAAAYRALGGGERIIATPVANRFPTETEPLIGLFANLVRIRLTDPELDSIKQAAASALAHQGVPYELEPQREDLVFTLQNATSEQFELPGCEVTSIECDAGASEYDTRLSCTENANGYRVTLQHRIGTDPGDLLERFIQEASRTPGDVL